MFRALIFETGQRGGIIVRAEQGVYGIDIYAEENRSTRVVLHFEDFSRGITDA